MQALPASGFCVFHEAAIPTSSRAAGKQKRLAPAWNIFKWPMTWVRLQLWNNPAPVLPLKPPQVDQNLPDAPPEVFYPNPYLITPVQPVPPRSCFHAVPDRSWGAYEPLHTLPRLGQENGGQENRHCSCLPLLHFPVPHFPVSTGLVFLTPQGLITDRVQPVPTLILRRPATTPPLTHF